MAILYSLIHTVGVPASFKGLSYATTGLEVVLLATFELVGRAAPWRSSEYELTGEI